MSRKIVEIVDGQLANPEYKMAAPINLSVEEGEQVAIVGDNAAGKTRIAEVLNGHYRLRGAAMHYDFGPDAKHYVSDNVKFISFRDSYGSADAGWYFQQRWNQMDIDPETPTVGQTLQRFLDDAHAEEGTAERRRFEQLVEMFHLERLMDEYVITLSSGELRKFQLTKLLISMPRMLIIDNPFIGLDFATRCQLSELFETLVRECGITFVLILAREEEIPSFITHVIPVKGLDVLPKQPRSEFSAHSDRYAAVPVVEGASDTDAPEVLRFRNVSIRYGKRTILKDLNWVVRQGEHWALTGENGSGKSTLLSIVCADNPQAYACDIDLFGRRRGTGESIWDIKKHIGFVSPEMHRSYCKSLPALDIVTSGVFDTVGLFRTPTDEQRDACRHWMEVFGIQHLAERDFMKLSSGEQRLCLLARAFVKSPALLILDEPMHGLDDATRSRVRSIINDYCSDPSKTLVMVTHYMDELPSCIDHSLVLKKN